MDLINGVYQRSAERESGAEITGIQFSVVDVSE